MMRIRRMTRDDLPLALRLTRQACWNQTEGDWLRLLDLTPEGCFVAEVDGAPRGTACTSIFGRVAWVAMVLVDVPVRRQGIGMALVRHTIDFLDSRGVPSIRLDATPLGRPLYERLGFVPQYELARWEGRLPPAPPAHGVRPTHREQLADLVSLDREVTGTDRGALLSRLYREQPAAVRSVWRSGKIEGYVAARSGANATQIGPCIAGPAAGRLLLADAFHRHAGQDVYLDIPVAHAEAAELARTQGLAVQRHLLRMCCGELIQERIEQLWTSFGPEKG
jgi:GNAT superfamily N-acetyltransferase